MACVAHSLPTTTAVCCNPNLFLYFCATNFVVQLRTGPVHTFPELALGACVCACVRARVCARARACAHRNVSTGNVSDFVLYRALLLLLLKNSIYLYLSGVFVLPAGYLILVKV